MGTMGTDRFPPARSGGMAVALTPPGLPPRQQALIRQSHERCAALGLTRIERPDFTPLMRSDMTIARERNQRLLAHAAPVMEMLFEQISGSESLIVLCDSLGTILHSIGDDDFLARAQKVALAPGVNWAEQAKGTNAIGTALFEERATLVHGAEHFLHANNFLTCSATPMFDPHGNMLGVLDVTGDQRSYHHHTMGLVRMSARMIENHWLSDDFSNRLRLHFHSRPEFIGTLLEGIVVVGADGKLMGANRSALDQLGMSGAALRAHTLTSLFGTTPAAVHDHFRHPLPVPMKLHAPKGMPFYASARFEWPPRGMSVASNTATNMTPDIVQAAPGTSLPARLPGTNEGLRFLETGDPQVAAVVQKVRRIVNRDIPLLILGDTGTGKELLARAVHHESERARQPFVAVNCASIPESLIEAELFGCEEGAFTGARRRGAPGRIVQASGGTLFLDEIGDMPLAMQARLLRVLQERCVSPLGGQKQVAVDIALICATHRNLREKVEQGSFREDLYYRINGLAVRLPPMRERNDLEVVVSRILERECPQGAPGVSAPLMALLRAYPWPGNLRQLANVMHTAAVMAAGEPLITEDHLSDDLLDEARRALHESAMPAVAQESRNDAAAPVCTLEQLETASIRAAVDAADGNISEAAKRLGISRNKVYRKLRPHEPREHQEERLPERLDAATKFR